MSKGRLVTWHADGSFDPKQQGILATCERIHMMSTGSHDFEERDWNRCREFLIERLTRWVMRTTPSYDYDSAVRTLIEITLQEKRP